MSKKDEKTTDGGKEGAGGAPDPKVDQALLVADRLGKAGALGENVAQAPEGMKRVRFNIAFAPYNIGEVAGFTPDYADKLVALRVAQAVGDDGRIASPDPGFEKGDTKPGGEDKTQAEAISPMEHQGEKKLPSPGIHKVIFPDSVPPQGLEHGFPLNNDATAANRLPVLTDGGKSEGNKVPRPFDQGLLTGGTQSGDPVLEQVPEGMTGKPATPSELAAPVVPSVPEGSTPQKQAASGPAVQDANAPTGIQSSDGLGRNEDKDKGKDAAKAETAKGATGDTAKKG